MSQQQQTDLAAPLIVGGGFFYGLYFTQFMAFVPPEFSGALFWFLWFIIAAMGFQVIGILYRFKKEFLRFVRSVWPNEHYGSAGWLSKKEAQEAGMFTRKGFYVGVDHNKVLWYDCPSHALLIAPTRAGKTVSGILPQLGLIDSSAIVTDIKSELFEQTANYRKEQFGHEIVALNLRDRVGSKPAHYNVCILVVEAIKTRPHKAIADARAIAGQLNPTPDGGHRDPYWPGGTNGVLMITILGLAVIDPDNCHLVEVNKFASDPAMFQALCETLADSDALGGDLAAKARAMLSTANKTPKELASFCNGAAQAVAAYSESSTLGRISKKCTFRFHETKHKKMTIYMGGDTAYPEEIEKGAGLWNWAAMQEIQRVGTSSPVYLFLDEAYQYKIKDLPSKLMSLTGFGIRCYMVFQSLASIEEVYGKTGASSIMGQCSMQAYFGITDWQDAEKISAALGKFTQDLRTHRMGGTVDESGSAYGKSLMSAEEVRRLPADQAVLFTTGNRSAIFHKVGYHEIEPLRSNFAINRLYGDRPWKGRIKIAQSGGLNKTLVTKTSFKTLGMRIKKPWGKVILRFSSNFLGLFAGFNPAPLIIIGLIATIWIKGIPYVRIDQQKMKYAEKKYYCEYIGLGNLVVTSDTCPIVVFKKL